MTAPSAVNVGFTFTNKTVEPKCKAQGDKPVKYDIKVKTFQESPEGFSAVLSELEGENGVIRLVNAMYDQRATSAATQPVRTAKADANMAERIASGIKAAYEFVYAERGVSKNAQAKLIDDTREKLKNASATDREKIRAELLASLGL